jgi:peroxiredoxin
MKHAAIGLALVVLASAAFAQGSNMLAVGSQVQDFSLQDVKGQTYKLSDVLRKEGIKGVLLTVYSTDCDFCVTDMPKMQTMYNTAKDRGLRWIGISIDASRETARNFAERNKLTLINLHNPDKKVARSLRYAMTPHSVLVDRNRKVVRVYAGTSAQLLAQMRTDVTEYLSKGKVTSAPPAMGGG